MKTSAVCGLVFFISLRAVALDVAPVDPVAMSSSTRDESFTERSLDVAAVVPPEALEPSYSPLESMKEGLRFSVDRQSQWTLGLGALAFVGARTLDPGVRDWMGGGRRIGDLNKLGNEVLGTAIPSVLIGGGLWAAGDWARSPYHSHAGQALIESLLATTLLVSGIKQLGLRERPDGSSRDSLPSAHTAFAFTTASVLSEFYGWKVGVPAYLLGALTAASRIQDNRHWLSDTVAGATLSILVGRAFSRSHIQRYDEIMARAPKTNVTVSPTFRQGTFGIVMRYEF